MAVTTIDRAAEHLASSRLPPEIDRMKSFLRRACIAVTVLLAASGATASPPTQMTLPFNAADVAWSLRSGTAIVEGRATLPTTGGVPHTCAGGEAQLFPAGTYAAEMMRIVFDSDVRGFAPVASAHYPNDIAADFKSTVRRVGCDPAGGFRFDGVAAGSWYVFSNVIFRGAGETALQGGALMQRIDVTDGARANVLLSP
jgi:hypothetical protein